MSTTKKIDTFRKQRNRVQPIVPKKKKRSPAPYVEERLPSHVGTPSNIKIF